jgi:hypothetical protein
MVYRNISTLEEPSRREAIKQLALLIGVSLSASSLSALAASFANTTDFKRRSKTLLNPQQLALVRELGELIIPTTDTPGAIAAGVHDFINYQLVYCFSKEDQTFHLKNLDRIAKIAQEEFGKSFIAATKEQQIDLLTRMEKPAAPFTQDDRNYFKQLKSLVVFGYYTSEIGATQELKYLAIPGGYKGNVKIKEIGRTWAL